jgi:hypothetical protein
MKAVRWPGRNGLRFGLGIPVLVGIGAALAGCRSDGQMVAGSPGPVATPVVHPLLRDIPVPEGFRLLEKPSKAWYPGGTRVAHCEFEGDIPPLEVVRFYEENMPVAQFTPGPKSYDGGASVLRFENEREECSVLVKSKFFNKTLLVVDVGPLSKGSAVPGERPAVPPARK